MSEKCKNIEDRVTLRKTNPAIVLVLPLPMLFALIYMFMIEAYQMACIQKGPVPRAIVVFLSSGEDIESDSRGVVRFQRLHRYMGLAVKNVDTRESLGFIVDTDDQTIYVDCS